MAEQVDTFRFTNQRLIYGFNEFQVAALAALIGLDKREKLSGDWEEL